MEIVEDNFLKSGRKIKRKPTLSDRGLLVQSNQNLQSSTSGLYLKSVRDKKMSGGIFELLKHKRKLENLEKKVNTGDNSRKESFVEIREFK